ncbi:MAG: DUF423 domain-containing protein [Candidatus Caenarcaniphilales bacterium]|nr:DUF423 domain-containing protein [Candidatus Caenarcaniphilales bacterium]
MLLVIGSLLGFGSVLVGALAEHKLKKEIDSEHFRHVITAVRYNQIHAVLICAIALAIGSGGFDYGIGLLNIAGYGFALGILLFCFSIYASAFFKNRDLNRLAPFGGISFMIAWLVLASVGMIKLF